MGISVENTDYLHRVEVLKDIPAVIKFVSYEPALEYVDFTPYASDIDWLISGGESGNKEGVYVPRPAELDWFRRVRADYIRSGIACFHKQHGGISKIDGEYGGFELDGKAWNEFPDNGQLDVQIEPSNGTVDELSVGESDAGVEFATKKESKEHIGVQWAQLEALVYKLNTKVDAICRVFSDEDIVEHLVDNVWGSKDKDIERKLMSRLDDVRQILGRLGDKVANYGQESFNRATADILAEANGTDRNSKLR